MKQNKSRITWYRPLLIVLAVVAVVTVGIIAYYLKNTEKVENTFTPAVSVLPTINENFKDSAVKENVSISIDDEEHRTGYPVYVRAAIVVTWQDKDGIVYYKKPALDTDYSITINDTDWIYNEADGFYYFTKSVPSGGTTEVLISECKQLLPAPADGYTLNVNIIAQTVQAIGYTDGENNTPEIDAVEDAWGISLSGLGIGSAEEATDAEELSDAEEETSATE